MPAKNTNENNGILAIIKADGFDDDDLCIIDKDLYIFFFNNDGEICYEIENPKLRKGLKVNCDGVCYIYDGFREDEYVLIACFIFNSSERRFHQVTIKEVGNLNPKIKKHISNIVTAYKISGRDVWFVTEYGHYSASQLMEELKC